MIKKIVKILNSIEDVSAWKLIDKEVEAEELFFVGQKIDMNRSKKVRHIYMTVYHDFGDSEKYRGSVVVDVHPTFTEKEIKEKIKKSIFSAQFIKNQPYPLSEPATAVEISPTKFETKPANQWLMPLTEALYESDTLNGGGLNSAELFFNKEKIRILNSNGVDVNYISYKGFIEFIAEWSQAPEVVELYKDLYFSDYYPQLISNCVKKQLQLCKDRSIAKPTPSLNVPVIISGDSVKEFLGYYLGSASAENVYKKISTAKIGKSIQGDDIAGDKLNVTLEPELENSTKSIAWDMDGYALKPVSIIEDGILKNYFGPLRFTHYLDSAPTGNVQNIVIQSGSISGDELKNGECLDAVAFSDFQCNIMTGDFLGEIRLAYYYPEGNEKRLPVTGGSISGNIKKVQETMLFSSDVQIADNFKGPDCIKLFDVSITGLVK